jgi:hypothetical protein
MDYYSEEPCLIYQFWFVAKAPTESKAVKAALPTVKKCEDFADSMGIPVECCRTIFHDEQIDVRVQFNIRAPQVEVLVKMAALFSFAASMKLFFVNQFWLR